MFKMIGIKINKIQSLVFFLWLFLNFLRLDSKVISSSRKKETKPKPVTKPTIKPSTGFKDKLVKKNPEPTEPILFLNRTRKAEDFQRIQSTLNCFAKNGAWKFDHEYHQHFHPHLSSRNNSQRLVPCFPPGGYFGIKAQCNKLFEGNMTFYQWKVPKDRCGAPYKNFDVIELCRLFAGRSILFVGDSMMELMVGELSHLSRWQLYGKELKSHEGICHTSRVGCTNIVDSAKRPYGIYKSHHNDNHISTNQTISAGVNQTTNIPVLASQSFSQDIRLLFVRNDVLSLTAIDKPWSNITNNIESAWIPYLDPQHARYDPTIRLMVLNRGIHYQPDTLKLLKELRETLLYLRKNVPFISIVWRSTVFGHYEAMDHFYEHPLKTYNVDREAPKNHPNYHYHHVEAQNQKIAEMLSKEFPEVILLDVLPSTQLRRGGHRDPLHYCIPGPMDQWNELLVALLRMMQTI